MLTNKQKFQNDSVLIIKSFESYQGYSVSKAKLMSVLV